MAVPAVLLSVALYVLFLRFWVAQRPALWRGLVWFSRIVMLFAVIDAIANAIFGAVRIFGALGSTYWAAHLLVVLAGTPALANILLLPPRGFWFRRWYAVLPVCWLFGVWLVFFQVSVGETLFGPDGVGGPFSP